MKIGLFILISIFPAFLQAGVLITQNFVVTIKQHCEEGIVSCDSVTYEGISKKTGDKISLKGSTLHTMCADSVTPCQFLGYVFENGNITYRALNDGTLQVIQDEDNILLEEQGEWQW